MSTELARQNTQTTSIFTNPEKFELAQRSAKMLACSELVPKMYQATAGNESKAIANCIIAMEMSERIGASPLMIMQNMYIVHGNPAWSSKFLIATVNACGRYNSLKYEFKNLSMLTIDGKQIQDVSCVAYTSEKGNKEEILRGATVSIGMAIAEGWYQKTGSKWKTMPQLMLQYRAATLWARTYAPELSMGLSTKDEIEDIQDVDFEEVVNAEISNLANKETIAIESSDNEPKDLKKPIYSKPTKDIKPSTDFETAEELGF